MTIVENLTDVWYSATPEQRDWLRVVWRELGKALDELVPPDGDDDV